MMSALLYPSGLFQSTRPRGARRDQGQRENRDYSGFNPRAREGRDVRAGDVFCRGHVSIHAPARGATLFSFFSSLGRICFNPRAREGRDLFGEPRRAWLDGVSIHAPARGATGVSRILCANIGMFQSTRPRGARRQRNAIMNTLLVVSIHAPARGATAKFAGASGALLMFQSTRPRGARPCLDTKDFSLWKFQSTRPRGARPASSVLAA